MNNDIIVSLDAIRNSLTPRSPFKIALGSISYTTMNTAGNKVITGIGFLPQYVRFTVLESVGTGYPTVSQGAMTSSYQYSFGEAHEVGSHQGARWSSTTSCIERQNHTNTVLLRAVYVSMDNDGFTINVTIPFSFSVQYEAWG